MSDPLSDWLHVTRPRVTRPWGAEVRLLDPSGRLERPEVDAVAFVAVARGQAVVARSDFEQPVRLAGGDVLLMTTGPAHEVVTTDAVALCGSYAGSRCPVTSLWARGPDVLRVATENEGAVATLLALIVDEISLRKPGAEHLVGGLLDAFMTAVLRVAITRDRPDGLPLEAIDDPIAGPALAAMHHAPEHPWTVEKLARKSGVSRSLLAKRFNEAMKESPMSYLRRWRMSLAVRLLLSDRDMDLEDVARRVGYESQYAFSRAFKRIVGTPPGKFRSAATEGAPSARA